MLKCSNAPNPMCSSAIWNQTSSPLQRFYIFSRKRTCGLPNCIVLNLLFWSFEFVSGFGFRASYFPSRPPILRLSSLVLRPSSITGTFGHSNLFRFSDFVLRISPPVLRHTLSTRSMASNAASLTTSLLDRVYRAMIFLCCLSRTRVNFSTAIRVVGGVQCSLATLPAHVSK